MLYFAYGSNLDPKQMKERCPGSSFKCIALLTNFRVAFTRYSGYWEGGVADVVEDNDSKGVWGVVYDITQEDLKKLDVCEGYRGPGMDNDYDRCGTVVLGEGDDGRPLGVLLYTVANKSVEEHLPSKKYMKQIISGAERWGLPNEYIEQLKGLPVSEE